MDDIGVGILQYWEQLLFFLGALVVAVRLQSEVSALRKDVDLLEQETKVQSNSIQENFVSSVRTESSVKETEKKIVELFKLYNILRDKVH